jgi:hypothetical protein
MKKVKQLIFAAICLMLVAVQAQAVEITFRVDMAEQTVSPLGVHIAGSFQGWDPAATEMTLVEDAVYAYTIDLEEGAAIEFKYVNGNAWGMDESVPGGCAQNNNRFLTVPAVNTTLEAVCFGSCALCNPDQVEITFQVDMSNETVSALGVFIAGSFQGWLPGETEMLPIGNNVYAITLELGIGTSEEYKFLNGNTWEAVPPECALGWNRFINIPAVPTTLDAVCFGSCDPCGPPPVDVSVTFNVDLSEQVVSPDGVHIGAGFQGWDPGGTLMEDAGDNIYTYTAILPSGTYQEYKYVNGTTWEEAETVPNECGLSTNRYFTVPMTDTVMEPPVCFGGCGPCGPPPVDINVTFRIDMSNETVSPDGIHVAGNFQGWDPASTVLTDIGDDIYETTLIMSSGTFYEWKYINGITFEDAEIVPEECGTPDGQGGFNRFMTSPQNDTAFANLCFGSCELCLPPMPEHEVTFRIDMSNEEVSGEGVHLAGSFQGWNSETTEMTNAGDNVYEITLLLEEGDEHEYKYINGITFDDAETVPAPCGVPDGQGGYNRFITIPANDTTMPDLCFASCEPCVPPADVNVTFRVDMSNESLSADGLHIAGTFQGWDPAATELTLVADDIWEFSQIFVAGSYIEYKFINGNTFEGTELVPDECGVPDGQGGFNRYLTVPADDIVLPDLCFSSCDPCLPPIEVNVTFRTDLHWEVLSANGVHIAGNFQGWNPGTSEMTLVEDEKYEFTTTLYAGTSVEYKFINGDDWDGSEEVPEDCGIPDGQGGFNRTFTVPAIDTTLGFVCFSQCVEPCYINSVNDQLEAYLDFYPNPASDVLYFNQRHLDATIQIYTIDGKIVCTESLNSLRLNIGEFTEGLYFIRIMNDEKSMMKKLLIK